MSIPRLTALAVALALIVPACGQGTPHATPAADSAGKPAPVAAAPAPAPANGAAGEAAHPAAAISAAADPAGAADSASPAKPASPAPGAADGARPGLLNVATKAPTSDRTVVSVGKDQPRAAGSPETDAMVKEADELRRKGDYPAALRRVQQALQIVPQHPQGLVLAGTLEGAMHQTDQAAAHLKQAVALMPDNLFARKVYASVLLEKHNSAEALEVLGPVLQASPPDLQAQTMAAQISAASADFDQARRYLDKVLAIDPGFVPARELAVKIAMSRHQPEEARVQLEALVKARPDDGDALMALANLDLSLGRGPDAEAALKRAREARPEAPDPLIASSELALRLHHVDEAAGFIKKLGTMVPDAMPYLSLKGQLAMAQGHPKDAVEPLKAALAKQPLPEVLVQLHQALLASGDKAEADKRLGDWIGAHPDDLRIRFYAAQTAARQGNYAEAGNQYRKILDKEPDNPVALNDLAQSLQAQHDPKAVEYAEKAWKLKPDSPVTENTLGGILMSNGQSERGLGLLRDAAGHAQDNPEVRFDYARALAATGDKAKAKSELEGLLALKRPFHDEPQAREMLKALSGG